jgi:prepilin-type N-terminal cleavage/methylation domain-containing protein
MQKSIKNQKAFTMLELVFVIVILGIVSSIGAEIIADVYRSYILERATHRSSIKTELAANQLLNRLTYSIYGTVIGRKTSDNSYRAINDLDDTDYDILEWISYDNDSFSAKRTPGWSAFIDLDTSTASTLDTKGSDLSITNNIIQNLGANDISDSAIFFPGEYTAYNVGYDGNNSGVTPLQATSSGTSMDVNVTGKIVTEHYKLGWSAYALVPVDNGDGTFNLELYYGYQPWQGETYSADGQHQTLVKNVSVFKFMGSDNTIRFKICQRERITNDRNITLCKEKAVIR